MPHFFFHPPTTEFLARHNLGVPSHFAPLFFHPLTIVCFLFFSAPRSSTVSAESSDDDGVHIPLTEEDKKEQQILNKILLAERAKHEKKMLAREKQREREGKKLRARWNKWQGDRSERLLLAASKSGVQEDAAGNAVAADDADDDSIHSYDLQGTFAESF